MMFSFSPISSRAADNAEPALTPISSHNPISTFPADNVESIANAIDPTIKNMRLDGMPVETFTRILAFCSSGTLLRLSEVSYYFYFQVTEFFNAEVRFALSRIPEEKLQMDYVEYLLKLLKEDTDEEYFSREIFEKQKIKNITMKILKNDYIFYQEDERILETYIDQRESLSNFTIIKGMNPSINNFFQPGPIFNIERNYLREDSLLAENVFKEQFVRNVMFSRPLLKRGNLAEATDLFFNKNLFNITIKDFKKIGLLHSTEILTSVWTISSENKPIKEENPSPTTVIHPEYIFFIRKYYFMLCIQIQEPDLKAFLETPPNYIKQGVSVCADYNTNESSRLILMNMLNSNIFNNRWIYDETNNTRQDPLHGRFNAPFFELLLKHNFNIDSLDKNGLSPLDNALLNHNASAAAFFINHGATIHCDLKYLTGFLITILENKNNIAEKIQSDSRLFPVDMKTKYTEFKIIELLIENATNISKEPVCLDYFLAYVSRCLEENKDIQYYKLAQFLIKNGANIEIALKNNGNKPVLLSLARSPQSKYMI